ncbi:MAG: GntR family transcriptional regulator [Schaedlerella sp.]|nr:GntR family transcriptional regulator [Lachnospiraceae bacterium]MDY4201664.1 GntR family transcriptional regulator [Schaedlerella sp.]
MKILQNSGVPIYQQIAEAFKEEILTGKRKQGEYLPSIRGLAKELRISVITTMKAYEELEKQGLVTAGFLITMAATVLSVFIRRLLYKKPISRWSLDTALRSWK